MAGLALLVGCVGKSAQSDGGAPPDAARGPACQSSADCASTPAQPVCDVPTGRCVRCVTAVDCPASNDCTANACVPYTTCTNSLGCPTAQVCDTTRMRCVQCVGDSDCATDQKCISDVCRKRCASDNMCTSMGMLCDTAQGYCVGCVTSMDCKVAEYCSNATCVADVCAQGTSTCNNDAVVHCKADGSGFDPPVACATGQTCAVMSGAAACTTQTCTPTVTYCDPVATSDKVLVCSADGLTSTVKSDCATSSQVCVAGACVAPVCTKGMRFCQGQDLRQCTAKGDASTLVQTCTSTQYCDAASMMCKAGLCTPNQLGCSGNVLATCNADGSGFLAGGTDCSPHRCLDGACVDKLLDETFEDGTYSHWKTGTGTYTISATNTPGANGTMYALSLTRTAAGPDPDGISYTFPTPVQPSSISYWVKTTNNTLGTCITRMMNGTTDIFFTYLQYNDLNVPFVGAGTSAPTVFVTTDTWYHIEFRNIDWTARTVDVYFNDTALVTGHAFAANVPGIGHIELYNGTGSATGYWDEIELLP
jgi:hypothetical protein